MATDSPLKIVHVATHEAVYRGGAVQLCRMAIAQKRRGHEVSAIVHQRLNASAKRLRRERATWEILSREGIPVEFMAYTTPPGIMRLRRFIAARGFDILHAHRDGALLCSWIATRGMPRTKLVAQRGTVSPPPFWAAWALRSPRTLAVVAVAQAVKDALIGAAKIDAEKIHVVYGSVDLEKFSPRPPAAGLREPLDIPANAKLIGSLSAFRKAKGYDVLAEALVKVFAARPDAHAIFLGKHVKNKAKRFVQEAGIGERCRLLPHQSDVPPWISVMDLSVVAAVDREGLSGVLREALAMEIPVLSTDTAGNREIVRDRETGLLVPPGDAAAMADAIIWALDHPAEMKAMAQAGRRWVVENCSLETQAEKLEGLYRSLLPM